MIEACTGTALDPKVASAICGTYQWDDSREVLRENKDRSREWVRADQIKIRDQIVLGEKLSQLNTIVWIKKT